MGAYLVRGSALDSRFAAMTVPYRIGAAFPVKNVVLAVVDTGAAAGFFYNDIAGFFHNISPQADFNILNRQNMLHILSIDALYHNISLTPSKIHRMMYCFLYP